MKDTKQRILDATLSLFNQNGMVNVRLQHIADEVLISVGNLAYHFPNKSTLVLNIYQQLADRQRLVLAEYRMVPLFETMERVLRNTFELQQEYRFFYLDTVEVIRAYPDIKHSHQQLARWQQQQILLLFDFNISRGAFQKPESMGELKQTASVIRMTTDLWMTEQLILDQDPLQYSSFRDTLWSIYQPHFSSMGELEFQQLVAGWKKDANLDIL